MQQYHAPDELASGGYITVEDSAITIVFNEVHYALSTSALNGGFHHILGARNQQLTFQIDTEQDLPGGSVSNYLAQEFQALDLPINFCTGLLTSADMTRHVYHKVEQEGNIVETIVTTGVEHTAHRAGDGYYYTETETGRYTTGTINIMVFTNRALTDGAITRALIAITEAKTRALFEKGVPSVMNGQTATGTATDGIIFTIDPNGVLLTDSGTFSAFGDTLAKAVYQAVLFSLDN